MQPRPHRSGPLPAFPVALVLATLGLACAPEAPTSSASGPAASSADGRDVPGEGLVVLPSESSAVGPLPEVARDRPYFHSFGRVRNGEVVAHVFRLRNSDPRPVAIESIKPGCGCTVPNVRYVDAAGGVVRGRANPPKGEPLIEIPPGAVAEVELAIDTRHVSTKNSDKTVQTTITTDSPNAFYVKLETHIVVEVPFHLLPNGIDFGRVPVGGGGRGSMDVVVAPGYDLEVGEVLSAPDEVTVELRPRVQPGRPAWELAAVLHPPLEEGRWTGEVVLSTLSASGEPEEPLRIGLQADVRPDLVSIPARLVFVANDFESRGEVALASLLAGHRFDVTGAALPEEHRDLFDVSWAPEDPDADGRAARWIFTMRAVRPAAVTDIVRGALQVTLGDPQHPTAELLYVVHPARP